MLHADPIDHFVLETESHVPADGATLDLHTLLLHESYMYESDGQPVLAPEPSSETIGTPLPDSSYWHYEQINGMCGPDSLAMILSKYTGHPVSEEQVALYAFLRGEMDRDGDPISPVDLGYGMTPDHAAEVLNQLGVPATLETSNLDQLAYYLHQGREVMLFVNAEDIWHEGSGTRPDHWVVLTGLDPKTGMAYLNDPGTPYGAMEAVPISELMHAWASSDNTAIVTDHPSAVDVMQSDAAAPSHEAPTVSPSESTGHHAGPVLLPIVLEHALLRAL